MKKGFLVVLFMALICSLSAQAVPSELEGIWEGKDRFLFFENAADDKNPELVIVLKAYYGWYYDRAAEPVDYKEKEARTPNAATHKEPEVIPYTISQSSSADALQITITYSKHQINTTSFAILNDNIYLNPYVKLEVPEASDIDYSLWRSFQESLGFLMYDQALDQNISLLIMKDNKYYDVRYWLTDMDYDASYVSFKYKDEAYSVPKHLMADGNNYSCVNGRSKNVRNTMPPFLLEETNAITNEEESILILNPEVYLSKLKDSSTIEALMQLIKEANARRKPDPEPIFPVKLPKFPGQE